MKDSKIGQLSVCINEVREFMFYYAGFHRQKHNYNIHGANVKR